MLVPFGGNMPISMSAVPKCHARNSLNHSIYGHNTNLLQIKKRLFDVFCFLFKKTGFSQESLKLMEVIMKQRVKCIILLLFILLYMNFFFFLKMEMGEPKYHL